MLSAALPGADRYLAAHRAELEGKYAKACADYRACARHKGPLEGYARAKLAECLSEAGHDAAAASEFAHLLKGSPKAPWAPMAEADYAALLARTGQHARAAAYYDKVLATRFKSWWLDQYGWDAAENEIAMPGLAAKGYRFFRDLVTDPGFRNRRSEAAEILAKSPEAKNRWVAAEAMVKWGSYKEAEPLLAGLRPASASAAGFARWNSLRGRILIGLGRTKEGMALLRGVVRSQSDTAWGRLARAYLVRGLVTAGKTAEAKKELDRLVKQAPGTVQTGDVLWWYANRLVQQDKRWPAATEFARLASVCPSYEKAEAALLAEGRLLRDLDRPAKAATVFERVAQAHSTGRMAVEAAYAAGRIREAAGAKQRAVRDYRRATAAGFGDFYGHRALERLRALGCRESIDKGPLRIAGTGLTLDLRAVAGNKADDPPPPSLQMETLERLRFFGANGLPEGEWEALSVARHAVKGPATLALCRTMADAGLARTAAQLAVFLGAKRTSPAWLYLMYPRPYWHDVRRVARATGLDPYLLLAVGRQESTFRPTIVSSAGAVGVMQLMPATARWLHRTDSDVASVDCDDLTCPAHSLVLGGNYLMLMMNKMGGNLVYAVASYNGGPGNVSKWRHQRSRLGAEAFIESIPFGETRDYVKRVLGNYAAYRSLYGRAPK